LVEDGYDGEEVNAESDWPFQIQWDSGRGVELGSVIEEVLAEDISGSIYE
jgi:hypothetical protein